MTQTKYIVAIRASFELWFALASIIISPRFSRTDLPDLSIFVLLFMIDNPLKKLARAFGARIKKLIIGH